jgi:hypothetical protein
LMITRSMMSMKAVNCCRNTIKLTKYIRRIIDRVSSLKL